MLTYNSTAVPNVFQPALELVRYFPRQLITADDMRAEQEYFREKLRRHNRYLHGWGVACGCEVVPDSEDHPWELKISSGYVITPRGNDILVPDGLTLDLAGDWRQIYDPCVQVSPCLPTNQVVSKTETKTVYLAVCYTECDTRPVRIHPAGCGCDDAACEYSRIREGLELVRLDELPDSYKQTEESDVQWKNWAASNALPACSTSDDECVVIASITLPDSKDTKINQDNIKYDKRRVLLSFPALLAKFQGSQTPQNSSNETTPGQTPSSTPGSTNTPTTIPSDIWKHLKDIMFYPDPGPFPEPPPVEITVDPTPLEEIISGSAKEAVLEAKLILKNQAPSSGVDISLAKTDSDLMTMSLPAHITIPAGQTEQSFQIRVKPNSLAGDTANLLESKIVAILGTRSSTGILKASFRG